MTDYYRVVNIVGKNHNKRNGYYYKNLQMHLKQRTRVLQTVEIIDENNASGRLVQI